LRPERLHLDERTIVRYLVGVRVVTESDAECVAVHDLTARNRNFAVVGPNGDAFFVKQAAFTADLRSVAREGNVLCHLARYRTTLGPRLRIHDDEFGTIVVEFVRTSETLHARRSAVIRVHAPASTSPRDAGD